MNIITQAFEYFNRVRYIPNGNDPLMVRHYLLFKDNVSGSNDPDRKIPPFNAFIHNIKRSDTDSFHDHPWWYFTLILWGGYWEHTPVSGGSICQWRGPGYWSFYSAESLHYLEVDEDKPCWTLFIHGKRKREWGFIDEDGTWVHHEKFYNKRVQKLWEKAL